MAKLVLAGKANCPYYAKAELLADYLQANLPHFRVHKITQHPDKWEQWLRNICETNGWKHSRSPIIWRELLDRGGKGLLLGGVNDFLEYAQHYYGVTLMTLSDEMLAIAEENLQAHIEIEKEEEEIKSLIKPLQIWITSASVPICYQLIPLLANGEVFGMTTEISIHLLDTDQFKEVLCGIVMEAEDMAFPLLRSISEHTEIDKAFIQADVVIVLDDVLLNCEVQPLEYYVREVSEICQVYAHLIEKNAKSEVRVISSGKTFVNLKAMMMMTYGPSIKPENVIAVATSLESAAKATLARKLNMNAAGVKDVIVWGMLHAHAVATVLRYWYHGSPPGEIVSVGVLTAGQFCVPEGIVFSMPARFQNGNWEVMTELEINEMTQEVLDRLAHDLIQEKLVALKEIREMLPYGADKITSKEYLQQEMEVLPSGSH
ncbi:putative malate dehydrogenase 1B isoform B [Patagioenas fasciata monilis]|uniref:Putative malate dehydrogenase 1B isoform B n=1 Tax=Patagioenas fasciata monilis TaxID=372326 RepID=A0A1V4L036_PATFA|nr:putative malate dehydrogenase 1B isoform B [Patagioenas fasciata monilis]